MLTDGNLVLIFFAVTVFLSLVTKKIKNQKTIVSLFSLIFVYIFIATIFFNEKFLMEIPTFFGNLTGYFDGLSKFFIIPISIVPVCAFIYSIYYFREDNHKKEWTNLSIFFPIMTFSMVGIILAKNLIMLLIFWELMALSAFFLLLTEHTHPEVINAGKIYIILTHICTFFVFIASVLIYKATGTFDFPKAGVLDAGSSLGIAIFAFTIAGFGIKAGILSLHVWLPSAHANAPSNVSAVMSGLMIKMGIYGIIRFTSFFNNMPVWWGVIIFVLGLVSGVVGVILAIGQHDIKRLLAYHSIENIGIILMGLGLGFAGVSTHNTIVMALGFAGAILHIFNHAVFKSLLFLGAGVIINASGTRQIDSMGGLGKKIPFTFGTFLVASASISGLPPFNGFISEFFIYLGMFALLGKSSLLPLNFLQLMGIPGLALIGGLASACFIKVNSSVFMGMNPNLNSLPQSRFGEPFVMKVALGVLALLCAVVGVFPYILKSPLEGAILELSGIMVNLSDFFPFKELSIFVMVFYGIFIVTTIIFNKIYKNKIEYIPDTWGCGYTKPSHKFRYTATSFAEIISSFFNFILKPHIKRDQIRNAFPEKASFSSHVPDIFLDNIMLPFVDMLNKIVTPVRKIQAGNLNLYLLYKLLAIILFIIYGVYLTW